jgi:Zn-dependent protease
LSNFLTHFDLTQLILILVSAVAALFCITVHELSHGFAAYRLGDPTAKRAGRLTLNPIAHIDPVGLLLMLTVRVGWAKPVPVDMRYFKNPKRGMAITALAGPAANFLLSLAALILASVLLRAAPEGLVRSYVILFLCYLAVLSVGLGVFNLIPISPLDGSKVLFALLPDRIYLKILRYERYGMILMVALTWLGVFSRPLSFLMGGVLRGFCAVSWFPFEIIQYYFF